MKNTPAIFYAFLITILMVMSVMPAPVNPEAERTLNKRFVNTADPWKNMNYKRSVVTASPIVENLLEIRDGTGCDGPCKRSKQVIGSEERRSTIPNKENKIENRDYGTSLCGTGPCKRDEQATGNFEKRLNEKK